MNNTFASINTEYELTEAQQTEYQNILITYEIAKDMYENDKFIGGLSETQRTTLNNIMTNSRENRATALALLKRDNPDYGYQEIILDPASSSARMGKHTITPDEETQALRVYPNPTVEYFTVEYNTNNTAYKQLTLIVQDITGRIILTKQLQGGKNAELVSLQNMSPNVYTVILKADELVIDTKKLTVIGK